MGTEVQVLAPPTFNPYAHDVHDDPFPFYRRLRDDAPVFHDPDLDFWALSRYDDVLAGLHDTDTYCSRYGITLEQQNPLPMMLTMDPPDHTKMRRLVSRVFTPRRINELEPVIRGLSERYLAPVLEAGHGDLIADYSARLPMDVISTMLGIDRADHDVLRGWTDDLIHREAGRPDVTPAGIDAAVNLYRYFTDDVAAKRRDPGDDLTSGLLTAEADGQRLTDEEIIGFCFLLIIAGNETTTKLIGNAVYWLWRHPDQRRALIDEPGRTPAAIEETLRFEGSTQIMGRTTTRPVALHDEVIPEHARVLLLLGSANRDERHWTRPDEFDIGRADGQHVGFGHGIHVCLGAALARLETRIALEHVLARMGGYEIDEAAAERVHSGNVRGWSHLPLSFTTT